MKETHYTIKYWSYNGRNSFATGRQWTSLDGLSVWPKPSKDTLRLKLLQFLTLRYGVIAKNLKCFDNITPSRYFRIITVLSNQWEKELFTTKMVFSKNVLIKATLLISICYTEIISASHWNKFYHWRPVTVSAPLIWEHYLREYRKNLKMIWESIFNLYIL